MSAERSFQRQAAKVAKTKASELFREAIRQASVVEEGLKKTVNSLPLPMRIATAARIILRRWT